jgi:hypothetical protein
MKGKKRKIKKNSNNRLMYFFVTIGILVALAVGVYAFGTFNPSSFGHSLGELAAPAGCIAGQILQYNGTSFVCGSGGSGSACPSGMTASYSYVNEGEDSYAKVSVSGETSHTTNVFGTDTCGGDVNNLYSGPDFSTPTMDHGLICNAAASVSCRDIWRFRPCSGCDYYYSANDYVCKRRATLKCVE